MNFIKTDQSELAEVLRNAGYPEMNKEGKFFVFVNTNAKLNFSEEEKKNLVYTNKCCM